MRLMKKLTAFMTAAILCLGSVMPAYADFYRQPSNIKGVLINSESEVADVVEVGASQVVCNFPMSWAFQPNMMNAYGSFLRAMDNAGITVTMIVLNDWNAAAYKPELLPVSAPVAGVSYYGFNTLNEQGVQAIRDTAGILTSNFGNLVSNWVIGNEVNDVYEAICEAGDLKRQEGSSVKIVLYIAMPRHFDKADFLRLQEDIPGVQSVEI